MVSSCARDCQTVRLPGQVQPGEGARPAWFWWGWSCKRTSGTPGFAVAAAGEQVTAHLGGIAAAIAAGDRLWRQRLSYAVTAATLLPALGVLHDLADLIDKGADLDEVATKARTVLQTRSGLIAEAFDRQGGRTIDVTGWSKAAAEVGQAADVLTAVSHLLPLVLVIDDAHDLDPISLQVGKFAGLVSENQPERELSGIREVRHPQRVPHLGVEGVHPFLRGGPGGVDPVDVAVDPVDRSV